MKSLAGAWDALGFEVVEQVRVLRLESEKASGKRVGIDAPRTTPPTSATDRA